MIRKWATTLFEIAGMGLIVVGIAGFSPLVGMIAGGIALIVLGVRLA